MNESTKAILKHIPESFKEKFNELKEVHITTIDQTVVEGMKKGLFDFMSLNTPDEMKLVGVKFQFLTKDGILCETNSVAEGFNEEEWQE